MLRTILSGLGVLIVGVFAYVGYNTYAVDRKPASDGGYTGADVTRQTEPKAYALPTRPFTGSGTGAAPEVTMQGAPDVNGTVAPAIDTIRPNPPNGVTFGGSGHYQLYRQGDLTWRLNTDTGETCVIFATDEEWHKPKVYKAGCRGK